MTYLPYVLSYPRGRIEATTKECMCATSHVTCEQVRFPITLQDIIGKSHLTPFTYMVMPKHSMPTELLGASPVKWGTDNKR
jgi:hypothetical protein